MKKVFLITVCCALLLAGSEIFAEPIYNIMDNIENKADILSWMLFGIGFFGLLKVRSRLS